MNTNSAEVANVDSAAIDKVQNSDNNINEATAAQDDANIGFNARGERIEYELSDDTKARLMQQYLTPDIESRISEMMAIPLTINDNSPERQQFRTDKSEEYYTKYQASRKERKAFLVIGPPAAGKSTIADPLVEQNGALLLDSDIIKMGDPNRSFTGIPEYGDGVGSNAVHDESGVIADNVFLKAIENGDNLVYPKVGGNAESIRIIAEFLKAYGYNTTLVLNELPIEKALQRNKNRYDEIGRLVRPDYLISVGNKPIRTYLELQGEGAFDGYERYSNDVERGHPPVRVLEAERDRELVLRRGSSGFSQTAGVAGENGTGFGSQEAGATAEVAAPVQQATVTAEQPKFTESKTVTNTLTKAFGEDTVAAFEEQFPGMDEHEVLSEKRSLEIAANKIEAEGIDKVEYDLLDEKHIWGDGDVDAAMSIIGQRLAAGDADSAAIMAETLAEHETKVGQQIQALAKYSRTPEGMILEVQKNATNSFKNGDPKVKKAVDDATTAITSAAKNGGDVEATVNSAMKGKKESTRKAVVEKVQNLITKGDVSKNKIQNIVKEASGVPVLTEADIQQILEYMEVYKTSDDERTAKEAAYRAGRIVASKQGEGTKRQKLRAISYMNMLLNLKTGAKNFAANAPMAVLETVKDIPGTLIDKAVSKKLGTQRTTTIASKGRFATMAKSFGKGMSDAWLDMRHDVDTSPIPGRVENVRANTFKSEAMNRLERFVGQYMQLGDRGWAQMAYDGRIEELRSLGVDVNTPEAAQDAELYMLDRVFQNNSKLAQRAIKARNAIGVFGDLILPFARTPANITDKLLDYSPVGLARATIQWGKTAGTDAFDQKTFVDRLSRSLTGTGTLMLGVAMAAKGLITDEPEDQEGREMYKNAGVNSYAINVDGTYHTINWAEPAGSLLVMGATLYNLFGAEKGMQEASLSSVVTDTLKVGINAFVSNSFLSSVADMFESGSVGDSVEDTLVSSTSRLTPSQGAAIAKLFDDYERETYDPDAIKQQLNYLISRIPGLRETLPVKIATDGTPMEATTGKTIGERFYNNLINPGYYTKQTDDPINSEIYRLYEAGYTEQMLPTAFYTVNKHKLTADERHEYQKVLGTACYNAASKVVQSANYKAADDKAKTDMLNEAIADAIKSKDVKDFKSNLGK